MTLDALVAEASEVELLAQSWAYHSSNWGSSMQSQTKFESQDLDAREEARISEISLSEKKTQRRNEKIRLFTAVLCFSILKMVLKS